MGDRPIPIIVIFEIKSSTKFSETFFHADKSPKNSLTILSNPNTNISLTKFEDIIGNRRYRDFTIQTISDKDLKRLMDDENLKSQIDTIKYLSGNPSNEITEGVIHYYKDEKNSLFNKENVKTKMLAMIGVPRSLSIRDILDFIAPCKDYITEMKVVKDNTPNEYIILLKFINYNDANNFYDGFNNVNFNSLEENVSHLVYVSHVESISSSTTVRFPLIDVVELPTCPVCLERLDEPVNGILTIVCNHTFHSNCIQQMNESTCPVCRYPQTPQIMSDKYQCSECDLRENLWMCLICANIGCGRQERKHAELHFALTGHPFAIKIGSRNMVWDYAADSHVHRLITNTEDGKPVHVESGEDPDDKKATEICLEYSALLADQLATQRAYLESEFCEKLSVLEQQLEEKQLALQNLELQQLTNQKERQHLEKRCVTTQSIVQKLQNQYEEEKLMNRMLLEKQDHLNREVDKKDQELKNLQEQLRDLMLNLQMGSRIDEAKSRGEINDEDLNDATLSVAAGASNKSRRTSRKK